MAKKAAASGEPASDAPLHTVRDPETGRVWTLKGYGAMKGEFVVRDGIDLTKPIAEQVARLERARAAKPPRRRRPPRRGERGPPRHERARLVPRGRTVTTGALVAIAKAQQAGCLYVSPISAWEVAVALRKPDPGRRPDLGGQEAAVWFRRALAVTGARLAPVHQRVAVEAARVPEVYGRGDPGDCFLIATVRVKGVPIVTRDGAMRDLAADRPGYLGVIVC